MKKTIIFSLILLLLIAPIFSSAQSESTFKAKILDIQKNQIRINSDSEPVPVWQTQINYSLEIINKDKKNTQIDIIEVDNPQLHDVAQQNFVKGDIVLVKEENNESSKNQYFIVDYARNNQVYLLFFIFVAVLIIIARWKGLRALAGLVISFLIIFKFIIPQIIAGHNPLFITIIGSFFILLIIIYLTEGFNYKSTLAIIATSVVLLITGFVSKLFTVMTHLSGMSQEETVYLVQIVDTTIDFKGLLLAGILIGALGVLDDIVVSQIATVDELKKANPNLNKKEIFKRAQKVGISHIGSMTNTLFLAYAGISLPLIMLFSLGLSPFDSFSAIVNNEIIATEIVRTLLGSIGLVLAVPIANFLASYFLKNK